MTGALRDFQVPTLHLVVADDQLVWQEQLKTFFATRIEQWGFYRTGQFRFELHCCGSFEGFKKITGDLLLTGDLVYVIADLIMPRHEADQVLDRNLWKDLILWCLDAKHDPLGAGKRFEFCLISADERLLNDLYDDPRHGASLRRNGVKRVYKDQIEKDNEVGLRKIWEDLRSFLFENVLFCTVPETWDGASETIIWFGRDETLLRLLEKADEIAKRRSENGDFYVAFADACGYEELWFRLCCHLRGLNHPQIHNLAETKWRSEELRHDLQSPPPALLLSQIRGSYEDGHKIFDRLQEYQFFSALDRSGGLACFQFPDLDSDIDAERLLKPKENDVLQASFTRVHGQGAPFGSEGWQYRDSDRIIRFPDYDALKEAGVIRATIAFSVKQCQKKHGLEGMEVDPEVLEILAEIPWNEPQARGLDGLSMAISLAYENAMARKAQLGSEIEISFFPEEVQNHFNSNSGFAIRGRRLVRVLDQHWRGGWSTSTPEAMEKQFPVAVAGLVQIYDLFEGLQRLIELATQQHGRLEFTEEFPFNDFEALKYAYEFLLKIFSSPDKLQKQITEFRRYEHDRNWSDYFPSLEAREDWSEIIQHVTFIWPYGKFRLPTPIDDYLRYSGVIADIYREMDKVLPRHPDLQSRWQDLETQRRELEEELQEREVQRRAARRYAREGRSQPVLMLLGARVDERKLRFTTTLQSFLFFNAALAVCENLGRFGGDYSSTGDVKQFLRRPELGNAIRVLREYRGKLVTGGRLDESIFRRWTDEWPQSGKQHDAALVIARVAVKTLADHRFSDRLEDRYRELLGRLSNLMQSPPRCPINDVLDFIGMLRISYDKNWTESFWDENIEETHDALRGFVLATTDPAFRFGRVSDEGDHLLIWSRNNLVTTEAGPETAGFKGRLCAFDATGCFPIDDLIRINPIGFSPFAYTAEKWLDLTSTDSDSRPEASVDWLPNEEERKSSAVWRWTYEWAP
jgi:hypothetical protein